MKQRLQEANRRIAEVRSGAVKTILAESAFKEVRQVIYTFRALEFFAVLPIKLPKRVQADLRHPRGTQGRRAQGHFGEVAALPGAFHTQRARPCPPAGRRRVVYAPVATTFAQTTERAACNQWRTDVMGILPNETTFYRLVAPCRLSRTTNGRCSAVT